MWALNLAESYSRNIQKYSQSFQRFCNVFLNITCFHVYNETIVCLYPYNTVLLFHHIFVLRNHTKSRILQFYSVLILTVPVDRFIYDYLIFFMPVVDKFSVKNFVVFIFGSDFKYFFSTIASLMSLYFLIFSIVFPKNYIIHQLEKVFLKVILCFFS